MTSKKAMMITWKGLAFPRTAPNVMRTAAAPKSARIILRGVGGGDDEVR